MEKKCKSKILEIQPKIKMTAVLEEKLIHIMIVKCSLYPGRTLQMGTMFRDQDPVSCRHLEDGWASIREGTVHH